MSLGGCQINPIDVNFTSKKVWKFLIKTQLTKDPKRTGGWKVPFLMPIRVKANIRVRSRFEFQAFKHI